MYGPAACRIDLPWRQGGECARPIPAQLGGDGGDSSAARGGYIQDTMDRYWREIAAARKAKLKIAREMRNNSQRVN
jgi:hypothetical protein